MLLIFINIIACNFPAVMHGLRLVYLEAIAKPLTTLWDLISTLVALGDPNRSKLKGYFKSSW
jgi:hypothetical protein